MTITAVPQQHW